MAVEWKQVPAGPAGPAGPVGPAGAQGSAGPKGGTGGYYEPTVSEDGVLSLVAKNGAPEIKTTWSIKGPQGAKGADGAIGPAGPAGPAGTNATTTAVATTSSNGLMSSTDKVALDQAVKDIATIKKNFLEMG